MKNKIYFGKLRETAQIPFKRGEDAGYDIYPDFPEDYIAIEPGETVLIPTGICSAFSSDFVMVVKERSSTGSKGIGQRAGIIDSGYRGEWFIPITNHDMYWTVFISKLPEEETISKYFGKIAKPSLVLPYEKAIAQALFVPVPKTEVIELTAEEIQNISSERGTGALGSSGK